MAPTRYAPLREIKSGSGFLETLECGHTMRARSDMIGRTYTGRRRCLQCLSESCKAAGHPLDIERGVPTCRCGKADDAVRHVAARHHGLMRSEEICPLYADILLTSVEAEHVVLHRGESDHWHWTGRPWEVRTRPENR